MKKALMFCAALLMAALCFGQDAEILRIFKKLEMQQPLTEAEGKKLEQWSGQMARKYDLDQDAEDEGGEEGDEEFADEDAVDDSAAEIPGIPVNPPRPAVTFGRECPAPLTTIPDIVAPFREGYIALARELMTKYGARLGPKLSGIRQQLMNNPKPTDGSEMAAVFLLSGSGAAAIYCAAWSAEKAPQDVLTANTLGVALKDMKEFSRSLRVLKYADRIKPDIPVVTINMGWTLYEMGNAVGAKGMFNRALRLDSDLTSPHLGLGLIAECAGNHAEASRHLRIALADSYSAVGFAAYRQAKGATQTDSGSSSEQAPDGPRSESGAAGIRLPELPVSEQPMGMAQQKEPIEQFLSGLDRRIARLTSDLVSVSATVSSQSARAAQNPGGSLVFTRDFAGEIMMYQDMDALLFGPNSNFARATAAGRADCNRTMNLVDKTLETITQDMEKNNRLLDQKNAILEESLVKLEACQTNEACQKKVAAETTAAIAPLDREMEQLQFRMCKRTKEELDMIIGCQGRYYRKANSSFKSAVYDYYAFTDPIFERIYAPSYNEMLNIQRELRILTHQKILAGTALSIADMSAGYESLKCVEPPPPRSPKAIEEAELPRKKEKKCPLGDGLKAGLGGFSAELTCDHVTISGGEGLLGSITRDFNKHQTKIWVGAGVKAEYGHGNLTGEATVGVEVVIGDNNSIDDIGLTSSVKTGLGGIAEAEVSGRISLEGGPEITASAGWSTPDIPGL